MKPRLEVRVCSEISAIDSETQMNRASKVPRLAGSARSSAASRRASQPPPSAKAPIDANSGGRRARFSDFARRTASAASASISSTQRAVSQAAIIASLSRRDEPAAAGARSACTVDPRGSWAIGRVGAKPPYSASNSFSRNSVAAKSDAGATRRSVRKPCDAKATSFP